MAKNGNGFLSSSPGLARPWSALPGDIQMHPIFQANRSPMKPRRNLNHPNHFRLGVGNYLIAVLAAGAWANHSLAEDWGAYSITPVSAPMMVLEAVGAGTTDG